MFQLRPCVLTRMMSAWGIAVFASLVGMPAFAETLTLRGGDVLQGEVIEETESGVVFQHADLGVITVPYEAIAAPDETADADITAQDTVVKSGLFGTSILEGWDHELEAGLTGSQGNSEDFSFRVGLTSTFENDAHRWAIDKSYYRATSSGSATANEFGISVTKDWLLPDNPWFAFVKTRYDYDDFKDWQHRVSLYGGAGRQLVENEKWDVVGRIGGGATREFGSMDTSIQPEALAGLEAAYTISDRSKIVGATTAFPALDAFEVRVLSTAEWTTSVSDNDRISVKFGVEHEYESEVDPGIDPHDIKYYGGVVVDL